MRRISFNEGWTVWKDGHETERREISLPYDAMIHEKRDPDMKDGSASGFFHGGKYFYEKRFVGKETERGRSLIVEFEGVYMDSSVFLNGDKIGGHYYGYTNFFCDLTGKIRIGEKNVLLVIADNSREPNSRWYTGSGIYRPVWLWEGGKQHIDPQGLYVKTVSTEPACVEVRAEGFDVNEASLSVEYTILDGTQAVAGGCGCRTQIVIPDAKLWSDETPHLYTLHAELKKGETVIDETSLRFGVRQLSWKAAEGLMVNGIPVKLRGGCIHHDNGILGACSYRDAEERKLRKLKEFGFNAVRFSHCPSGKDLLDLCDELGVYVMDETFDVWRRAKSRWDYSTHFDEEFEGDTKALALKDYSHPSVVLYGIGNEIPDTGRSYAAEVAGKMISILRKYDGTRPITIANNAPMSLVSVQMEALEKERNAEMGSLQINELITAHPDIVAYLKSIGSDAGKLEEAVGSVFDQLDITGLNYGHDLYEGMHALKPERLILSSETFPQRMASNWKWVKENPWVIGDFQWSAWDYLGEAGVGLPVYGTDQAPFSKPYPCLTAACGSFDLTGFPEACAWYCAALWGKLEKPYIAVRPVDHSGEKYTIGQWRLTDALDCWTWPGCDGKTAQIQVYGTGSEAELFLNGKSLGRKALVDCRADFECLWEKGALEAVIYGEDGLEQGRSLLETANKDVCLHIRPEKAELSAEPGRLLFVPIEITDGKETLRMTDDRKIRVTVTGAGELFALGSGRPETEESFDAAENTSWHGRVLAVIRSIGKPGLIHVTAETEGLLSVTAEIPVR